MKNNPIVADSAVLGVFLNFRVCFVWPSSLHYSEMHQCLLAIVTDQSLDTRRTPHKYAVTRAN